MTKLQWYQRIIYKIQHSWRKIDNYLLHKMPGLPLPSYYEEERKKNQVDLWKFSWKEHKQIWKNGWKEYLETFDDELEKKEMEKKKQELIDKTKEMLNIVQKNASDNVDFMKGHIKGTNAEKNLNLISKNVSQNIDFVQKELDKHNIDKKISNTIDEGYSIFEKTKSKKPVTETVINNLKELKELASTGKDKFKGMSKEDLNDVKDEIQKWLEEQLLVGKDVVTSFVDGYRRGKKEELEKPEFGTELLKDLKSTIDSYSIKGKEDKGTNK